MKSLSAMFTKNANRERVEKTENPYTNARRVWNEHTGTVMASRMLWQVIGIISLLIALIAVAGAVHIGSQSKFVPVVVEVDKLGQAVVSHVAQKAGPVDLRVMNATIASFIQHARMVTPDIALQRDAVFRVYAHLRPNDPSINKMNEWLNGSPESTPFHKAQKMTVNLEIETVLKRTADTWQVDWVETQRNRQGFVEGKPYRMRALLTAYVVPPNSATTEADIIKNPLGIFIKDYDWSKQI